MHCINTSIIYGFLCFGFYFYLLRKIPFEKPQPCVSELKWIWVCPPLVHNSWGTPSFLKSHREQWRQRSELVNEDSGVQQWLVERRTAFLNVEYVPGYCVPTTQGGSKKPWNLFIKNCVFILTCLNFSHLQSTLHLMRCTYQGFFSTTQNSSWTHRFWCLLVLLPFFVSRLPHQQNVSLWGIFSSRETKRKSPQARSGE